MSVNAEMVNSDGMTFIVMRKWRVSIRNWVWTNHFPLSLIMVQCSDKDSSYITLERNGSKSVSAKIFVGEGSMRSMMSSLSGAHATVMDAGDRVVAHEFMHLVLAFLHPEWIELQRKDPELFNAAQDLEINSYLDIHEPFLHPADMGIPMYLTTPQYMDILRQQSDTGAGMSTGDGEQTDGDKNGQNSQDQNNADGNDGEHSQLDQVLDHMKNHFMNDLGAHFASQDAVDIMQGNVTDQMADSKLDGLDPESEMSKRNAALLAKAGSMTNKPRILTVRDRPPFVVEDLHKLIMLITRLENQMDESPNQWEHTWHRLPHKHGRKGNIIIPGKRKVTGGFQSRYDDQAILMVDVSGSTRHRICREDPKTGKTKWSTVNEMFMHSAYEVASRANVRVVFYNVNMVYQASPCDNEPFPFVEGGGGTDVVRSLRSLISTMDQAPRRVYVLTDGQDHGWKDLYKNPRDYGVDGDQGAVRFFYVNPQIQLREITP